MPAVTIRFKTRLLQPAASEDARGWTFLILPKAASAKLPTRGMKTVEGTLNGAAFRETLEPDGQGSHWLKVSRKLSQAAGVGAGDTVSIAMSSSDTELEPTVPADFRKALNAAPAAKARWSGITTIARRDWVFWIVSAKRPETRARRIENACSMLASGKKNVCCFDRSGMYSKSLSAPKPAD